MSFPLSKLTRPALLLDVAKARNNIRRMKKKAQTEGVSFRPHFKTHQSIGISNFFKDEGITKITVSSVDMARYFASDGWENILIAFPLNSGDIDRIQTLSEKIELELVVDTPETAFGISGKLRDIKGFWIEVDSGDQRSGIHWEDQETLKKTAENLQLKNHHKIKGVLTHAGFTYGARSPQEINKLFQSQKERLLSAKTFLEELTGSKFKASLGDTPSCSTGNDFKGINEVRPGNFIFYDLMQELIGACSFNDIAVCLAVPVVSKYKSREEVLVHGGGIHLSKDSINNYFGKPVFLDNHGWSAPLKGSFVKSLSQEHGVIRVNEKDFPRLKEGELIGILPVHSCLCADLMGGYWGSDGRKYSAMTLNGKTF